MLNSDLANELLKMETEDLNTRKMLVEKGELFNAKNDYHPVMKTVHEKNNKRVKEIIREYGWPSYSLVGKDGCHAAWLIVQHAILEPELQKYALDLLKQAANKNEADMKMVAFLEDRLLMMEGKPQSYGTQHIVDKTINRLVPYEIVDAENVNVRRAKIGMEPLEEKTQELNAERINNVNKEK